MGELLERELSRVLHELPAERAVQPTLYADVQNRARRIRRVRYAGTAFAAAVAVAIAAIVPTTLLGRHDSSAPRIPANSEVTSWPARGSLAGDQALRRAAIAAWQRALTSAHRGKLTQPVHELYADTVRDVGVVVVLAGAEPHGGQHSVVVIGRDSQRLSVWSDLAELAPPGIAVLLPESPLAGQNCVPTSQPAHFLHLIVITPPGHHTARWNNPICDDNNSRWHDIDLVDGVGTAEVAESDTVPTTVDVDRSAERWGIDTLRHDARTPVSALDGHRVASSVPVQAMPAPTAITTHNSHGGSVSISGGAVVGLPPAGKKPGPAGNALGWAPRDDASLGLEDLFPALAEVGAYSRTFPAHGSVSSGHEVIRLAMPDGTLIWGNLQQFPTGPTRLQLSAVRTPSDVSGYLDLALDPAHLPSEISAVVRGVDGDNWLFVAGAPGVAWIEYRAPGATRWQSMDVYESTGFLKLKDDGTGTIRLRTTSGTVVYEGKVDALHALS
jgi:hypothetical protein